MKIPKVKADITRPLEDKRILGPFFQMVDSHSGVVLSIPEGEGISAETVRDAYIGDFELDVTVTRSGEYINVSFSDEQPISTMAFGLYEIQEGVGDRTHVSSTTGTVALTVDDTYEDIKGSVTVLNSFLGQMESEAEDRDMDVDSNEPDVPSEDEIKEVFTQAIDEIAEGLNGVKSHRIRWNEHGYTARFIWEDNHMNLSQSIDVIAELANLPDEELGGAGRDLQHVSGKAVAVE